MGHSIGLHNVQTYKGRNEITMAQTALEWYIRQMFELNIGDFKSKRGYLGKRRRIEEQAKAMEKEQLNQARIDGMMLANKGYGKNCEYSGLPSVESYNK